jgi:foldase protein PrsA
MEKSWGKREVDKKKLWLIIASLVTMNVITLMILLIKPQWLPTGIGNREIVATIDHEKITRQEWLDEMEARHGKSILRDMIDEKVIEQVAKKHKIKVSKQEIDRELALLKTTTFLTEQDQDEEALKKQIKTSLLLEEILTKDAVVSEKKLERYYEQNKSLFNLPASYHLSQIVVKKKAEAQQTLKELKQGSSFSVLAMERSVDEFSANQGGDIGYVSKEDEKIPSHILSVVEELKEGEWTEPLKTGDGYTIYYLHEQLPAKEYSFKDVKKQIRRQIAMEELDAPVTINAFWEEAKVEWFYDTK